MRARSSFVLFGGLVILFLAVNHRAYQGYFQTDEIDSMSWISYGSASTYLEGVLTPRFQENNFRPVGHFYFREAEHFFGLDFPKYEAIVQAIHLLNVGLLWLLFRRLGASTIAAACGAVFFAFHAALFDDYWKPMYVFDLLCATFSLLSILFYSRDRWILSFLSFWLAYKSKELAVMLPLALAAYEVWFGQRRWKPLVPFFLASLSFGLQGIFLNPNHDNDYTFRFTPSALAKTSLFYSERVFLIPILGLLVPLAVFMAPHRRTYFGLSMMAALFVPLLFLPGRMFTAYCYVPFLGLAIMLTGLAETRRGRIFAAVALPLFLLHDFREFRLQSRTTLTLDNDYRTWITTVDRFAKTAPLTDTFIYSGEPENFSHWGVESALKYCFHRLDLNIHNVAEPGVRQLIQGDRVALLTWDSSGHRLEIRPGSSPSNASFIEMRGGAEPWMQLEDGWYGAEPGHRWIAPQASARLERPAAATRFELRLNAVPAQLQAVGPVSVRISLDGRDLDVRVVKETGWQTLVWNLPPETRGAAPAGTVNVRFRIEPGYASPGDHRMLGIAVAAFGFR